jgi:hypothetical protein
MLDIQCSEVSRGQVTLTWKPNGKINQYVSEQIDGMRCYLLIRVKNASSSWSEWLDIRKEKHIIWLREPTTHEIEIFPVRAFDKLGINDALNIFEDELFEYNSRSESYPKINDAFKRTARLIRLTNTDNQQVSNFDDILHYSFSVEAPCPNPHILNT